jgi:hypothetical protein
MSRRIAWLTLVVLGVGCGGTSETNDTSGGGSSQGGTSDAGGNMNTGGSANTGGHVSAGGSANTAGSVNRGGSVSNGGSLNTGGIVSSGGSGSADPRCPAKMPTGMCDTADAGLSCQYDQFSNCLCYSAGLYSYCQLVDSMCTFATGSAGAAGAGGAGTGGAAHGGAANAGAAGSAGSVGAGGFQAKIAAPPQHEVCTCNAGAWTCNLGF